MKEIPQREKFYQNYLYIAILFMIFFRQPTIFAKSAFFYATFFSALKKFYRLTSSFKLAKNASKGTVSDFCSPYLRTFTACSSTSLSPTTSI